MNFNITRSKKILSIALCFAFVLLAGFLPDSFSVGVKAQESLEDLQKEYDDLEKNVQKNEKKLKEIQKDITTNENKLVAINSQIDTIKEQIKVLDTRISSLDGDIAALQPAIDTLAKDISGIEDQIKDIDSKIDTTKEYASEVETQILERIRSDYMTGGNASMLEVLLTSDDLTTFLSRAELVQRVTENDEELIDELGEQVKTLNALEKQAKEEKTALEAKKADLDSKKSKLVSSQNDLEYTKGMAKGKQNDLNAKYNDVSDLIQELDEDSEAYKAQIARQRADMNELANQIDNYIEENGSSVGDEPTSFVNDGDMIWPVPYSNTYVSCPYGHYSDGSPHWGMDICVRGSDGGNASNGKDIVAAQAGKVILSVNDGGYNYGYGNYCIIDHGNGIMTLYCHCKRVIVHEGQIVSKGQKIAEIGLTGNTTGYHLHFEVRIKNADGSVSRVNPANYV